MKVREFLDNFHYCTVQFFYGSKFLEEAQTSKMFFYMKVFNTLPEKLLNLEIEQALGKGKIVIADVGIILADCSKEVISFMNSLA